MAAPGGLDGGFGAGGKILTDAGGVDYAADLALLPGGGIVVAGASGSDIAVARYDAAGRSDSRFGGRGIVITDLGSDEGVGAVVAQPDGKVVVAARRGADLALVRYSADGALDPSFDVDGVVVTDLGGEDRPVSLLRQPDGRLVVAVATPDRLVLVRYLRDGRLDPAFGRGGIVSRQTPGFGSRMAVLQRDGAIVVAAARVIVRPQALAIAVARFRPNGAADRSFSGDGLTVLRPRPHWAGAVKVAVRGDGRVLVGAHGHNSAGAGGFAVVQFRRNGSLDRSFGNRGTTVSTVGFGVHALGIDSRGRIVTVGRTTSLRDWVVARFHLNGRRDRTFAATVTDFGGVDTPFALVVQRDGKFVVAGASSTQGLLGDIAVARYLSSP